MFRFLAIASALVLSMAAANAAPVTFVPTKQGSSVTFACTAGSNGSCNIDKAKIDFDDDDDYRADPTTRFQFLELKPKKADDSVGDNFTVTATLAFRILNVPGLFKVTSTGTGFFTTGDEKFRRFILNWAPIADLFVAGVGTFSIAFDNVNRTRLNEDEAEVHARITQISAVPLPAGAALLLSALGIVGAAGLRRRKSA